jgi:hypothetical protein
LSLAACLSSLICSSAFRSSSCAAASSNSSLVGSAAARGCPFCIQYNTSAEQYRVRFHGCCVHQLVTHDLQHKSAHIVDSRTRGRAVAQNQVNVARAASSPLAGSTAARDCPVCQRQQSTCTEQLHNVSCTAVALICASLVGAAAGDRPFFNTEQHKRTDVAQLEYALLLHQPASHLWVLM